MLTINTFINQILYYLLNLYLVENFSEYSEKPTGDNQLRKHIVVYNEDNEVIIEFKSGREMAG